MCSSLQADYSVCAQGVATLRMVYSLMALRFVLCPTIAFVVRAYPGNAGSRSLRVLCVSYLLVVVKRKADAPRICSRLTVPVPLLTPCPH